MSKLRKTLYLSAEAWKQLEKLADDDGRSISAYLDRLFTPRQDDVQPATPVRSASTPAINPAAVFPARPARPVRTHAADDDDGITHEPVQGEA